MSNNKFERAAIVQKHRLDSGMSTLAAMNKDLSQLQQSQKFLDSQIAEAQELIDSLQTESLTSQQVSDLDALADKLQLDILSESVVENLYERQEVIKESSDEDLFAQLDNYAIRHNIDTNTNLANLLSAKDIKELKHLIEDELSYQPPKLDKYDYAIACTCGLISGLIDALFVGSPKDSKLTEIPDSVVDGIVMKFAKLCGWNDKGGEGTLGQAIQDLEKKFGVNYDQRLSSDVNDLFNLTPSNHHLKNLAHSPDLIGLIFSVIDQFTNTSHFVSNGKIYAVETESIELRGDNFVTKVVFGIINWFGHLMSDVAGSKSRTDDNRGAGIPIAFFNLSQLFGNVGSFGPNNKKLSEICSKLYTSGYDFRFGVTLNIPVQIAILLVRSFRAFRLYANSPNEFNFISLSENNPEMRRMLSVSLGCLCLVDIGDAFVRGRGNIVNILLRTNLIAWLKFSALARVEFKALLLQGHINENLVDDYIEHEYTSLLKEMS